jgi:hypothetical protein
MIMRVEFHGWNSVSRPVHSVQWPTTLLWPMSHACVASTFARTNAMSAAVKNMVEQPACVLVTPLVRCVFHQCMLGSTSCNGTRLPFRHTQH